MSARKVATDALATLGTIHTSPQARDAIHIAVEPVTAGQKMYAGQAIVVKDGVALQAYPGEALGIVDPWLTSPVQPGDQFWFLLNPGQIDSLRHVWAHPAFPAGGEAKVPTPAQPVLTAHDVARTYLEGVAAELGVTLGDLLAGAYEYLSSGETMGEKNFPMPAGFWEHFETHTGRHVEVREQGNFISCCA